MNSPIQVPNKVTRHLASTASDEAKTKSLVETAARRVAPAFDIRDMVAVNPFLGYSGISFLETTRLVEKLFHADILPSRSTLLSAYKNGEVTEADLLSALGELGAELNVTDSELLGYVAEPRGSSPRGSRFESVLDQLGGESPLLAQGLVQSVTRYLAARFDATIAEWRPASGTSLYEGYLNYASRDRTPEILGLRGYRKWIASAPQDPIAALSWILGKNSLSDEDAVLYFGRLLAKLNGWASFLRKEAWLIDQNHSGDLPQLLAILALLDTAPNELTRFRFAPRVLEGDASSLKERQLRLILLRAKERAFLSGIVQKFLPHERTTVRPKAQAVFCIDVRSERLRRHLEATEPLFDTYGFAGFFGLPVAFSESSSSPSPHCPPLLRPSLNVPLTTAAGKEKPGFFERLKRGPLGALNFVESVGFGYSVPLLRDALSLGEDRGYVPPSLDVSSLPVADKVRLGAAILKNLGLKLPLSRVVLLVGHDAHVTNNPQKAGLSCGACAGHGGDKNALLASLILNDREVRKALSDQGTTIPDDVVFVPALHETVTDQVHLVAPALLPRTHEREVESIMRGFERAGEAVRKERAASLLLEGAPTLAEFLERSASASEVRPEWALAGNAAFIVARRERTRQADLQGRTFLHSYDEAHDPDGSILELILTAPAVVGSWINLQYYASTVAPEPFGSGTKTLHNVVGGFAVTEGNEGDLAVGLSRESVMSSDGFSHDPLRLQLIVEASESRLERILQNHPSIGNLVRGGWLSLYSLSREANELKWYDPNAGFVGPTSHEQGEGV